MYFPDRRLTIPIASSCPITSSLYHEMSVMDVECVLSLPWLEGEVDSSIGAISQAYSKDVSKKDSDQANKIGLQHMLQKG